MAGWCTGPGGAGDAANARIRGGVESDADCRAYCDALTLGATAGLSASGRGNDGMPRVGANCVGYAYTISGTMADGETENGRCALYGPGVDISLPAYAEELVVGTVVDGVLRPPTEWLKMPAATTGIGGADGSAGILCQRKVVGHKVREGDGYDEGVLPHLTRPTEGN